MFLIKFNYSILFEVKIIQKNHQTIYTHSETFILSFIGWKVRPDCLVKGKNNMADCFFLDFFDYFLQQWQKVTPSRRGDRKNKFVIIHQIINVKKYNLFHNHPQMKNPSIINTYDLLPVANVCNQELREIAKLTRVSVAHVIMQSQAISLSHKHQKMREIYYILSGKGVFYKNNARLEVEK